jgi:signal transduction histidine kinase
MTAPLPLPTVLLVDDRRENLVAMEAALAGDDVRLRLAASGREALELLLREEVALALVDVQMPDMDGFELAELMRGTARTRGIPIIFVTAGIADRTRVFRGYESGAVDFLAKPIDLHVLRSKVQVFLELDRQRRQLVQRVEALGRAEAQLREADRQKDAFLASLSHEMRNPLMPILTSLYVLDRVPAGSDQSRRALEVVNRQVRQLTRLVDDLLDVTRISNGKIALQRAGVDLVSVVRATVADHRGQFAAANIGFEEELPESPLPLHADAARVSQIVGNLLANASKFTPSGGHVRLRLAREDGHAVLSVADDGAGLADETLGRLFQPFAQADRTLDRSRGGLGLGLAIVKALVEQHGGHVEARSDGVDRGSTFIVRLPLVEAHELAAPAPRPAPKAACRVLLVEDNVDGAQQLWETLALMGHEVRMVHDGAEALAAARAFRPHLVICDIGLPGLNGYEVARRLRREPGLEHVRLVALSGYALPQDRERSLEAGFDAHFAKPPSVEMLERMLDPTDVEAIQPA